MEMQIKTTRYHFILTRMVIIKMVITSVGKTVKPMEPSFTAGGNVKWCRHFGKSLAVTQRAKHRVIILSSNSTPPYIPKRMKTCVTQKLVHKCSQNVIHNSQKVETMQMSIN